jgi:ABC-2 type transport system ATP-binding protein
VPDKQWIGPVALVEGLAACGGDGADRAASSAPQVAAQAFDITVPSPAPDNFTGGATTLIAASVFIPAHRRGETYPLILHSHGWGGDRITPQDAASNPDNDVPNNFYSVILDRQVKHLWDAGYAVISFDERGFGGSGGAARVMDPAYETRDAIALLDWAEDHLALSRDASGDPYVGSIGGSYGGGFQLMLATQDPRLDAMVPGATWYDLPQSLVPNGVIKKLYDFGLCVSAVQAQRKLDPVVHQICLEAGHNPATRFEEDVSSSGVAFLGAHGMRHFQLRHEDPADSFKMRKVDALFVQGNRDVLFPVNQALANLRFLKSLGGDVRLLTNEHGHFIGPPLSGQPGPGWWGCGPVDSTVALQAWFDAKLRGRTERLAEIPALCLSLDDSQAVMPGELPVADDRFTVSIPATAVTGAQNDFGGQAPAFIPLGRPIAGDDHVLAGIPVADLTVTSLVPGAQSVAFLGIGIRGADGSIRLVDDQINPLRSSRTHEEEALIIVGERLRDGDEPGVLLYGAFHHYEPASRTSFATNAYTVSGTVRLPISVMPIRLRAP